MNKQTKKFGLEIACWAEIKYIQSMLNVRSDDVDGAVAQAVKLEQAGCDIIRAAVPDKEAVRLIPAIKESKDSAGRGYPF